MRETEKCSAHHARDSRHRERAADETPETRSRQTDRARGRSSEVIVVHRRCLLLLSLLLLLLLFWLWLGLGLFGLLWGLLLLRGHIGRDIGIVGRGVSASCCRRCRRACRLVDSRRSDTYMSAYLKIKVLANLQPKALRAAPALPVLLRTALLVLSLLLLLWLWSLRLLLLLRSLALLVLRCAGWLERYESGREALAEAGVQRADGWEDRTYEYRRWWPELRARGCSEAECRSCGGGGGVGGNSGGP